MSQTPRRDEAGLDPENRCSDEPERELATARKEQPKTEDAAPPPPQRRHDPAHREALRQPFSLK